MKRSVRFCRALILSATLLTSLCGLAHAQRGGGGGNGGGGGSSSVAATPLIFSSITAINGTTPACSGDYTITNPIPGYYTWTTFKVNIKAKPIELPDNSALTVTLYTRDSATGASLPPVRLADMIVLSKTGLSKSSYQFLDLGILYGGTLTLRVMDKVVVSTASGQIVMIGR